MYSTILNKPSHWSSNQNMFWINTPSMTISIKLDNWNKRRGSLSTKKRIPQPSLTDFLQNNRLTMSTIMGHPSFPSVVDPVPSSHYSTELWLRSASWSFVFGATRRWRPTSCWEWPHLSSLKLSGLITWNVSSHYFLSPVDYPDCIFLFHFIFFSKFILLLRLDNNDKAVWIYCHLFLPFLEWGILPFKK